ncbi:response regulator [Vibrio cholerae]|uniref:response regulator n=1 Tax=Vibrio cholerae TaxID=666 RepID=UPI002AB4A804|nr:transporter substrate-binding domain-containing protein [Vibrio cholerae]MDY7588553.1 response regulator [Vibrio cholerae]
MGNKLKSALIIFSTIFSTPVFPELESQTSIKKIYPSSALYSLLSSSCKNGGRDINIGIIDDLDEPFRIKFDNYISGIESDYLITILPCDIDNIRYISYTSIDELKRAMDDDLIQFSIAGSGFDDTDYKKVTFISEKYVALTVDDMPELDSSLSIGYVNHCFSNELQSFGYDNTQCVHFDRANDAYISMTNGDIDATIINYLSAIYLMNKIDSKTVNIFKHFDKKFERHLIYKNPDYGKMLNLKKMRYKSQLIKSIWHIDVSQSYPIELTSAEKKWIAEEKPVISVAFNSSLPPYTFYDSKGNEAGIMSDYLSTIGVKTGLKFQWVRINKISDIVNSLTNNSVNMGTLASYTDEMEEYLSYTIPYSSTEISVVTNKINNENKNKIIAVSGTYNLKNYLKNTYPNAKIIFTDNTLMAVELVAKGSADSAYGYSEVMNFLVNSYFQKELIYKVISTDYQGDLRFVISKKYEHHEMLKSILDKSIVSLGFGYIDKSNEKWDSYLIDSEAVWVEKEEKVNQYFHIILTILFLIFLSLIIFYLKEIRRKEVLSEWQFKANLIDGIPMPIIVRDTESRFVHFNKAFAEFSSKDTSDFCILGKKTSEYPNKHLGKDFLDNEEIRFFEMLKSPEPTHTTIKFVRDDEEMVLEEWSVPYQVDGKTKGLITGWIDLTEINHLNSQLIISRDEAIKANRDKSNFIAVMSHEIRTPLNAIIGSLEVSFIEEKDKYIRQAYDASLGLIDIINNVLDISKVEVTNSNLKIECINVTTLIHSVSSIFTALCNQKNLDFIISINVDEDIYIYTDQVYIRQIFNNLLSNAIKYTDSGSVSIACHLEQENVIVTISDTGVGMSDSQLNDMALPFVTDSEDTDSYGLGSAIVHKLCSVLNIDINIRSVINLGTEIQLAIPKTSTLFSVYEQSHNNSLHSIDKNTYKAKLSGKNILVVDDYDINRRLVEKQLSILDIDVVTCHSALEAWRLINQSETPFDMLITDCYMPDMTGFELTEVIRSWEIKNRTKSMPIIGFTANSQTEVFELCLKSGMNDCIFKPINLKDLQDTIYRNLNLADEHIDIVHIRRFSYETGQSFQELTHLLHTALKEIENQLSETNCNEEFQSIVHKLKGITRIIGDLDLLEKCELFEKDNQTVTLAKIAERVTLLITSISSIIEK